MAYSRPLVPSCVKEEAPGLEPKSPRGWAEFTIQKEMLSKPAWMKTINEQSLGSKQPSWYYRLARRFTGVLFPGSVSFCGSERPRMSDSQEMDGSRAEAINTMVKT